MFDWNDQELTNIIWGDAGESDDHVVPYPEQVEEKPPILYGDPTKKEINHNTANVSPVEQTKPTVKSEHGVKLDSTSKHEPGDPSTGCTLSWPDEPDPSLSDAVIAEQDSMGNDASKNIIKNSINGSSRIADETTQFDKDSQVFPNPQEDGEQVDFVDYGWANIGSFDDLDKIFSNNDPIFGDISVANADELWTSSKDITSTPLRPTSLNGDSSDLALGPLRTDVITSHAPQDEQASIDTIEHSGGKSKQLLEEKTFAMDAKYLARHKQLNDGTAATFNEFREKGNKQKRLPKGKKLCKNKEVECGTPFQQVNSQYGPSMVNPCPPLVHTRPEPKQFLVPPMASPVYWNMLNYYPAPSNKPPPMTPKEKIEKLRRRQQMRAILAIQRQQQQFGPNQAENPLMDGRKVEVDESLVSIPSLDLNSPVEQDDFSMAFDNCSVEESVLYRLQDTIAKLDIQIRLCIRDSLYRLAESAKQRQYFSDTSITNTIEYKDADNHERLNRMGDVEKDTNPIDRTVAHLLFHRPYEAHQFSKGAISAKGFFSGDFENNTQMNPGPGVFSKYKNSPHLDTFEKAEGSK